MMKFTKYIIIGSSVILLLLVIIGVSIISNDDYERKVYVATVEWIDTLSPGSSTTKYVLYCKDGKLMRLEKNVVMKMGSEDEKYIAGLYRQTDDMLSNDMFKVNGVTYEIEKDGGDTILYSRKWDIEDMNVNRLVETNESLMKYWMFYSAIDNGNISAEKFESKLIEEGYVAND